jgi:hypothetical protein
MMRTRLRLKPGQPGTKKLLAKYGERLVCVRYRYDEQKKKRYKTVELILEETAWEPGERRWAGNSVVRLRVGAQEGEVQRQVRRAGGKWNRLKRVWEIRYDRVKELGLEARIVGEGTI